MAYLEVQNLIKNFSNEKILKGISFSLEKGETLAIIGSSGGGKTTLLRCLNSLEKIDGGSVKLDGKTLYDSNDSVERKNGYHFGLVFQSFNLFPQYTVEQNVSLAPKLRKIDVDTKSILEKVGLWDKRSLYPHQLSGGQCQRAAIARALALKPDILCFDEPTSALDPELTGEVLKVIKGLKEDGRSMIIVTHEMNFAKNVADKVLFIADGTIIEQGTPKEVFDEPKNEKTINFLKKSLVII